jgi:hypothetical protein
VSASDEVRAGAEAGRRQLDEAGAQVARASATSGDLAESAAAHGWSGLAEVMRGVQEDLTEVVRALEGAVTAAGDGIALLGQITAELSSDEVAHRLAVVAERLRSAHGTALQALASLETTRTSADRAGAHVVARLLAAAQEHVTTARDALESAGTAAGAEGSAAAEWGRSTASGGGPAGRPPDAGDPPQVGRPGNVRGPLGRHYRPGVHDPEERFTPKERAVADWLVTQNPSLCVHPRHRDAKAPETSPDAMVRTGPEDAGTVAEFKTLEKLNTGAFKQNARTSVNQVLPHGNGHVVIDGRPVGLTHELAQRGYARFLGERRKHGGRMPRRLTAILSDGTGIVWEHDV